MDRHVCVSQAVADFSVRRGGLSPEKMVVIPNGVDLSRYPAREPASAAAFGIPRGRRIVTFIGRLEPQKGVSWLIEAAATWLPSMPDCDLLLVGDGPLRARLAARCQAAGIADRVHFAGWRPDVPEILAASDLLVLPSAWEGMPNVVLEAMATGLPVVATDVEGVREALAPFGHEQIVPYGDTQAFAEAVVKIMIDRPFAAAIGAENRRLAEQKFAISRMIDSYAQLWESLATA